MKESEKAENNVNVREIIANLLSALNMSATAFSNATGIAYMRIFDLQRGRTKKFNPGVVNMICQAFPQINKLYLYSGEGPIFSADASEGPILHNPPKLNNEKIQEIQPAPSAVGLDEVTKMLSSVIELAKSVEQRNQRIEEKAQCLAEKEQKLAERERELVQKMLELENVK